MKKIFDDLYHGRYSAWERRPVRTAESIALNNKIEDEKRYFMLKMSMDDVQRFQVLENLYMQANSFEQVDAWLFVLNWVQRLRALCLWTKTS